MFGTLCLYVRVYEVALKLAQTFRRASKYVRAKTNQKNKINILKLKNIQIKVQNLVDSLIIRPKRRRKKTNLNLPVNFNDSKTQKSLMNYMNNFVVE